MEGRGPGYDDWFDEPEGPVETQSGANRGVYEDVEEVWVLPEDEAAHDRSRRGGGEIVIAGRTLTTAQAAIIVGSVLAVLFALLAAAGVFSSGKAAVPPVTTPPVTVTVSKPATTPVTPPVTQAPQQTLSPGATGSQVKILQRALKALGFSPGTPDGDYGPSTQTAVEKFQASKNLAQDGVVGQQTLAALQQALSG
jgi:Putative peptidoglycan binding domain